MLGMRGVSGPRTDVLRKAGPKWAGKLLVRSVQTVVWTMRSGCRVVWLMRSSLMWSLLFLPPETATRKQGEKTFSFMERGYIKAKSLFWLHEGTQSTTMSLVRNIAKWFSSGSAPNRYAIRTNQRIFLLASAVLTVYGH